MGKAPWFGDFELLEQLGQGGMAKVVRARSPRDRGWPPLVALKFLRADLLAVEGAVDAFRYEARLGLRCLHPNLCRTLGYEVNEGRAAIVLEYIEGPSLAMLRPYSREPELEFEDQFEIATILAKICRGLHALHELSESDGTPIGAVHRDITPQNVIIDSSGEPKIIDLGVAYSDNRTKPTAQGLLKGKVAYLAPEYLVGLPWDRRLDVWSVGVLAWELLAGRRLFKREDLGQTVRAIVNAELDTPSSIRPHLDPTFDKIVLTALQREPEKRFPSAAEMADALVEFVDNAPDRVGKRPSGNQGERSSIRFRRRDDERIEEVG